MTKYAHPLSVALLMHLETKSFPDYLIRLMMNLETMFLPLYLFRLIIHFETNVFLNI